MIDGPSFVLGIASIPFAMGVCMAIDVLHDIVANWNHSRELARRNRELNS